MRNRQDAFYFFKNFILDLKILIIQCQKSYPHFADEDKEVALTLTHWCKEFCGLLNERFMPSLFPDFLAGKLQIHETILSQETLVHTLNQVFTEFSSRDTAALHAFAFKTDKNKLASHITNWFQATLLRLASYLSEYLPIIEIFKPSIPILTAFAPFYNKNSLPESLQKLFEYSHKHNLRLYPSFNYDSVAAFLKSVLEPILVFLCARDKELALEILEQADDLSLSKAQASLKKLYTYVVWSIMPESAFAKQHLLIALTDLKVRAQTLNFVFTPDHARNHDLRMLVQYFLKHLFLENLDNRMLFCYLLSKAEPSLAVYGLCTFEDYIKKAFYLHAFEDIFNLLKKIRASVMPAHRAAHSFLNDSMSICQYFLIKPQAPSAVEPHERSSSEDSSITVASTASSVSLKTPENTPPSAFVSTTPSAAAMPKLSLSPSELEATAASYEPKKKPIPPSASGRPPQSPQFFQAAHSPSSAYPIYPPRGQVRGAGRF